MKKPKITERIICFKVFAIPSEHDKLKGVTAMEIIVPTTAIARLEEKAIPDHEYIVEFQCTHDFNLPFVPVRMEAYIDKELVNLLW